MQYINMPEIFVECLDEVPDLMFILTSFPGTFLAGGALRTLFSPDETEEFSPDNTDIDLFFYSADVAKQVKDFLESSKQYKKVFECPAGQLTTFVYLDGDEPKWKIQCITIDYYSSPESVIDSFDFTVTMFGTDGVTIVMGDTSQEDVINKELKWHKITYPSSSLRRMMKYARKSYHMKEPELQNFVEQIWLHSWTISDAKLVYVD